MRWQIPILILLLASPLALSGCTTPVDDDDIPVALEEDEAYVRIYVKPPMGLDGQPIWDLRATPRLVAFLAGDNETREALGDSGFVGLARGWPDGWSEEHGEDEAPQSAVRDWMRPASLWFEGVVPAGNYSVIRLEVLSVQAADGAGRPLEVKLLGDRLSVGPAEGDLFTIAPGLAHSFVMESIIQRKGDTSYVIQ